MWLLIPVCLATRIVPANGFQRRRFSISGDGVPLDCRAQGHAPSQEPQGSLGLWAISDLGNTVKTHASTLQKPSLQQDNEDRGWWSGQMTVLSNTERWRRLLAHCLLLMFCLDEGLT